MTKQNINEEIDEIRSHLDNMEQQRKSKTKQADSKVGRPEQSPKTGTEGDISEDDLSTLEALLADFDAQDVMDTVSTHAKAWMSTLNEDLKHTKPSTLLTVFGLGVIVGRLTK
jgi:hypothetical protein